MPTLPLNPSIRPATEVDLGMVQSWIRELAAHEGRPELATIDLARLHATLWPASGVPACWAWILESSPGVPAGYLWCSISVSTFTGDRRLLLEDLYITPAGRSGGLGAWAMHWLARTAHELECTCIDWSVVDNNPRAMAFYDRLGATRVTSGVRYRWSGDSLAIAQTRAKA
jgi:GNAT superfamily N-acetyltransferase